MYSVTYSMKIVDKTSTAKFMYIHNVHTIIIADMTINEENLQDPGNTRTNNFDSSY